MNVNEPYTVKEDGIISVCAACFPGTSIFARFPALTGATISHGYCAGHLAEFMTMLANTPRKPFVKAGK